MGFLMNNWKECVRKIISFYMCVNFHIRIEFARIWSNTTSCFFYPKDCKILNLGECVTESQKPRRNMFWSFILIRFGTSKIVLGADLINFGRPFFGNINTLWKFSRKQIRDTDSYSDTDSTKHDFDFSNQTLNDY